MIRSRKIGKIFNNMDKIQNSEGEIDALRKEKKEEED